MKLVTERRPESRCAQASSSSPQDGRVHVEKIDAFLYTLHGSGPDFGA
ncbi:hypothetical protein ABIF63_005300 [Bradyrhizobium japonicum]|uniref:Uncharacterized protein n=1 Tax=Bradyrhizobium japonicum TaxID=375 RepID=A0ABV2RY96_BRAJP|nr:hypothetical protein [Bradyrhizobium japonicum]UQD95641.1 hypothetical protein JEY30_29095 [Bradyrhizobium japonicum]WLB23028.1 hypothetical protein QIH95_20120 [Bradyrhizobium japonicum]